MTSPPDNFAARVMEAMLRVRSKSPSKTRWKGSDFQNFVVRVLLEMRVVRVPGRHEFFKRQEPTREHPYRSTCGICLRFMNYDHEHDHLFLHWRQVRFIATDGAETPSWDCTDTRSELWKPPPLEESDEPEQPE